MQVGAQNKRPAVYIMILTVTQIIYCQTTECNRI